MENNQDFTQYVEEAQALTNRLRRNISGSQEYCEFLIGIATQLKLIDEVTELRKEIACLPKETQQKAKEWFDPLWNPALAPDPNYYRPERKEIIVEKIALTPEEKKRLSEQMDDIKGTTGDGTSKPEDSSAGTTSSIPKEKLSELSPLAQNILSSIGLKGKLENG